MASSAHALSCEFSRLSFRARLFHCESSKFAYIENFSEKILACSEISKIFYLTLSNVPNESLEISSLHERSKVITTVSKTVLEFIDFINSSDDTSLECLNLEDKNLKIAVSHSAFVSSSPPDMIESLALETSPLPRFSPELEVDRERYIGCYNPKNFKQLHQLIKKTTEQGLRFIKSIQYYENVLRSALFFRENIDPRALVKTAYIPRCTKSFMLRTTLNSLHFFKKAKLGEGTFGKVYRVVTDNEVFAFKSFKSSTRPEGCPREENFLHETSVMLCLPRRATLVALDAICHISVILPCADEGNLFDKIDKGDYTYPILVKYLSDIADALLAMHGAGFIHKDVKPNNILLYSSEPRARLCDFSLSALKGYDTHKEMLPFYKPPELFFQKEDERVHESVDCWSFGVILFQCITKGALPFFERKKQAPEYYELVARERFGRPCSVQELFESLDHKQVKVLLEKDPCRYLLKICADCLHGDPRFRTSMNHVVYHLEQLLSSL